ncbi:MAG: ATP-binding protein [Gemmatimonadaceae bacterium]
MTFRTRLVLAFSVVALVPLIVLAVGVRREMDRRLTAQYDARVTALATLTRGELARQSTAIGARLASLEDALADDNRFRLAAVAGERAERPYLLDYAGRAMRLTGLSMLQIQDSSGRILSSGQFRNEYDRLEPDLPPLLAAATGGVALVRARTPDGPMLVLARTDSLRLGARAFTLVGGVAVGPAFLRRLSPGADLALSLVLPDAVIAADSLDVAAPPRQSVVAEVPVAYVMTPAAGGARTLVPVHIVIAHTGSELGALRASLNRWFLVVLIATGAAALLAATWLSARVSRPLRALADRTARVDLDRLDVDFPVERDDEFGALSRLLRAMTHRLRASAANLRDAERRATTGDLARQVNHDIKNGLAPIRHVLRHLAQVQRDEPETLGAVFAERRSTLDESVTYLDTLARNYARLTPRLDLRPCDANAVARDVAAAVMAGTAVTATTADAGEPRGARAAVELQLDPHLPAIAAEPLVLRRILENLVTNAIDALDGTGGRVTLQTEALTDGRARVTVADTGHGMTREQLDRAFDDFQSTKPGGTGLGLSIVRRLVADLHADLRVETEPGAGTRMSITFPARHASTP